MSAEKINNLGRMTAFLSFMIGTAIFAYTFISLSTEVLFIGFNFVIIAILTNLIVLLIVLKKTMEEDANREELIATMGIMILNIPFAFLYIWLIFTVH